MNQSTDNKFKPLLQRAELELYNNCITSDITTVHKRQNRTGKFLNIPKWDNTSNTVTETSDAKSVILEEHVWVGSLPDNIEDEQIATLGSEAGQALAENFDKELIKLFNDDKITQQINEATVDQIKSAGEMIRQNQFSGKLFALVSPVQAFQIKLVLGQTGNSENLNKSICDRYVGEIDGITILEHGLVEETGCVFASDAFVFVKDEINMDTRNMPETHKTAVVVTGVAGVGLYRPELAVKITS